ncbi:uncharacterized protein TNCV_375911 [Trichonephila clavipes]|nr:uncharacterized protein TNCV_375911 [Trichonephila clavipes]
MKTTGSFNRTLFLPIRAAVAQWLRYPTMAGMSCDSVPAHKGCGSPVVKVSNHGRHVMSSIPVPLKTRRVGQRCTLNLSRAETSSRWCGVVVRRGGASSGVVHVTWPWFKNYVVGRYKPLVAEQCDDSVPAHKGCGSPVVKVSNHGRHVMRSIPVPLKTRRVGQRCTLNLSRAETSSRWCGVVARRGGASSGVVHVTWPWFKITWFVAISPLVAEQCDVNIHSLTHRDLFLR